MTPPSRCLCPFPLRNLFFVSVSCFGRQSKRFLHCRCKFWRVLIIDDRFAFCGFNFSNLFICELLPFYMLNGCKDAQSYSPHDYFVSRQFYREICPMSIRILSAPAAFMYRSTPSVSPVPASRSRIAPTVPTLSVMGHPPGSSVSGGFPWGSRPGQDRRSF